MYVYASGKPESPTKVPPPLSLPGKWQTRCQYLPPPRAVLGDRRAAASSHLSWSRRCCWRGTGRALEGRHSQRVSHIRTESPALEETWAACWHITTITYMPVSHNNPTHYINLAWYHTTPHYTTSHYITLHRTTSQYTTSHPNTTAVSNCQHQ